eukprot:9322088-Alexandrium_andersonii.AAC.1
MELHRRSRGPSFDQGKHAAAADHRGRGLSGPGTSPLSPAPPALECGGRHLDLAPKIRKAGRWQGQVGGGG